VTLWRDVARSTERNPRPPLVEVMYLYKSIPQPIVQYSICTSRMLGLRGRALFFRPREQGGVFPLPRRRGPLPPLGGLQHHQICPSVHMTEFQPSP
jgi:hypothetical protein